MKEVNNKDYIPLSEKLAYGSGEVYGGGYAALIGCILSVYLTKILSLDPLWVGNIILISKVWDAVSDPLMGVISDNTRTKIGRRKPWIIIGGILIPVAFMLMFAPVSGIASTALKTVYACGAYFFLCTVNTISQVPYCSLSAELSSDFNERNKANSIKLLFSMAGSGIFYLLPLLVFEMYVGGKINGTVFFLIIGLAVGIIFGVCVIAAGIKSKERIPYNENSKSTFSFKNYIEPLKIKSYRYHLIMYVCAFLCSDIISALVAYYILDVMQGVQIFGKEMSSLYIIAPIMVMAACTYPLNMYFRKKHSKQFAYRWGLPFYILGGIIIAFFPRLTTQGAPTFLILLAAIMMGIGFGGAQMMPWMIFPDTVDVAELKTNKKDTGTYSGLMTFSRKLCTALALWLVNVVLSIAGYDSSMGENPQPIIEGSTGYYGIFLAIRLLLAVSVLVLMGIAIFIAVKYKITDKKLERVKYYLEKQREDAPLTEEEAKEKEALIEELA